jgi:Tol biopolymer transport system component
VVTGSASEEEYLGPAAWSPDGKSFAYVRITIHKDNRVERKIEIADIASRQIDVIASSPRLMGPLAWTRNNSLIYSLSEEAPNQKDVNLWRMQLDSPTRRPKGPGTRITNGHGFIVDISAAQTDNHWL